MDIEKKIELVKRKPTEEVITEEALKEVFESYTAPRHYIGFEISGMVHLGTGLCSALKIKDFLEAGIRPTIFLADYHTWINGKLGGDIELIQKIAKGYFKHAFLSLGLEEDKVRYLLASELYDNDYWADVLRIAKDTTIKRILRCVTIMGRKKSEALYSSAILYPILQAADIFKLDAQIVHAGMDQRRVHMLAHELSKKFNKSFVSVHAHIIPSLSGIERMNPSEDELIDAKMSKSKPGSAIFIHDSEEEIKEKIMKGYCPEKITTGNTVYEIAEYLILREKPMHIERERKFGGDIDIANDAELKKLFTAGDLHPLDLKKAVIKELTSMLEPSREYFKKHGELLTQIKEAQITR